MKKLALILACALAAACFAGCDTKNGRVDANSTQGIIDDSERTAERRDSASRRDRSKADTDGGVLHHTASTIGEVGEDIVEGAEDVGSSVMSNISDATHDDDNSSSDGM